MKLLCAFNLKTLFDRFRWYVNPIRAEFEHVKKYCKNDSSQPLSEFLTKWLPDTVWVPF